MLITDTLALDASGLTLTRDGYLVGDAKVSRAGNVQKYYGHEIGLTGDDAHKVFGVYRDPDVVFHEDSMRSLAGRPVTRNHPSEEVTADNWKTLAKGQIGGVIRRDGEHVVAPMAIMDADAVREVKDGARSLSAGYRVEIVRDEGVSPDGEPYQFRQAGALRFNHVAYLPNNNPRAGNTRLGDEDRIGDPGEPDAKTPPIHHGDRLMTLKTITVDGLPVETTDAGIAAIEKLRDQLSASQDALKAANDKSTETIAAKDAELAKKDAEIDALKGKVLEGPALDAAVAARGDLIAKARAICPDLKTDGVSDSDIRKAVVLAKRGDAAKDKSQAYIDAAFDLIAEDAVGAETLRNALTGLAPSRTNDTALADAQADYVARLTRQTKKEA